ncbi:MAG: hypothetical protein OXG30_05270 [bacterium]|nr:hypothetical protein [bacterium]
MSENIDTLLVVENWARDRRDKYHDRLNGMILHGEQALSGALLMQWFEEDFDALHSELRTLRTELRQPA